MKLVTSKRQLRKIAKGEILQAWDGEGPCPFFFKTPAVVIKFKNTEYIVFTTLVEVLRVRRRSFLKALPRFLCLLK